MDERELTEQVIIVTGAAAGIGQATARLLGRRGARLGLMDIDGDAGRLLETELQTAGVATLFCRCDVTKRAEVDAVVAAVHSKFGRIDGLVNNAGGPAPKRPLWDMDEIQWDDQQALNLRSAFLCCRAVLPRMIEGQGGSIVSLTSDQAYMPTPGRAGYAAAKAAIVGLTRALAVDGGPHHVRANAVSPGPTLTARTRQMAGDAGVAALAARHPLGRLADPDDIAETIAFLLSPRSRHISGQVVQVSGGLIL